MTTTELTVQGQTVQLGRTQAAKIYAVVNVRAAALKTDAGFYVPFLHLVCTTNDIATAKRSARHERPGPGASTFVVRVQDSAVILDA